MVVTALLVTPERVDVHDGGGGITFFGDLDLQNFTPVVNQLMGPEQLLPACFPTLTTESPQNKRPRLQDRDLLNRTATARPYLDGITRLASRRRVHPTRAFRGAPSPRSLPEHYSPEPSMSILTSGRSDDKEQNWREQVITPKTPMR